MQMLHSNAEIYRLTTFLSVFIFLLVVEAFLKSRQHTRNDARFFSNVSLVLISSFFIRLTLPLGVLGASLLAEKHNLGLLNLFDAPKHLIITVLSIIVFDFLIYCQHVASHKITFLWKFHQVHHSDTMMDVSTSLRFHPVEMLLSMLYKMLVVLVFGFSFEAVLYFEIILSAMAMFTHANIQLGRLEKIIGVLFVTPSMHLIHHSQRPHETDSNYGFCLNCWDRVFFSFTRTPQIPFRIGLKNTISASRRRFFSYLWHLLVLK